MFHESILVSLWTFKPNLIDKYSKSLHDMCTPVAYIPKKQSMHCFLYKIHSAQNQKYLYLQN